MAEPQVSIWIRARDAATRVVQGIEGRIRTFGRTALAVGRDLAAIGTAAAGATLALTRMSQRGAEVMGVQRTFNRLVGEDGPAALARLEVATEGVISKYDLMQGFNTSLALGSARNVEEFSTLARTAQQLGRSLGIDAARAL